MIDGSQMARRSAGEHLEQLGSDGVEVHTGDRVGAHLQDDYVVVGPGFTRDERDA